MTRKNEWITWGSVAENGFHAAVFNAFFYEEDIEKSLLIAFLFPFEFFCLFYNEKC